MADRRTDQLTDGLPIIDQGLEGRVSQGRVIEAGSMKGRVDQDIEGRVNEGESRAGFSRHGK